MSEMLKKHCKSFEGKMVTISDSVNIAIYDCKKAYAMGPKIIAMSDSNSWVYDENWQTLKFSRK